MVSTFLSKSLTKSSISTVSLVIAHPDDEIMFFNQFLVALNKANLANRVGAESDSQSKVSDFQNQEEDLFKVNIVCLTNGDNEKKYGKLRENELKDSCKTLLSNYNLDVNMFIHIGSFVDSMTENWNITEVKQYLRERISCKGTGLIVTFDQFGISSHINHRTCNEAVLEQFSSSETTHIWTLKTPSFFQKYMGILVLLSRDQSTDYKSITLRNYDLYQVIYLIGIMGHLHKSQMVWYRWLWWIFNSLVWSSTFEIVHFPKKDN